MAETGRVLAETMDGVALLTLAGATGHNVVDAAMWRALEEAIDRIAADDAIRSVVLTGGGHVAFAIDPAEPDPAYEADAQPEGQPGIQRGVENAGDAVARGVYAKLAALEKPVIARVRGECVGAGVALVLAADVVIAAEDSAFTLGAARAAALGVVRPLVETVGAPAARFLLLTGLRIEAREARRIGLANQVVEDGELSDTVADLARALADEPPGPLRAAKRAIAEIAAGR